MFFNDSKFIFDYEESHLEISLALSVDEIEYELEFEKDKMKTKLKIAEEEQDFEVEADVVIEKTDFNITWGIKLFNIPSLLANHTDFLVFNFNTTENLKIDEMEIPDETEPYNVTVIHFPKANLFFSFEDLYAYDFSVDFINATYIQIGNVTGKTELIIDPITYSIPNLQGTGGASGSEIDMEDFYEADLGGTLQLSAPAGRYFNETRLFDSTSWEGSGINGLASRKFHVIDQTIGGGAYPYEDGNATLLTGRWGIRVFVRHEDESEDEITSGTPVAQVSRSTATEGYQNGTWSCPETALESTDSIRVNFYLNITGLMDWTNIQWAGVDWSTEQLGGDFLCAGTWIVEYYTKIVLNAGVYRYLFYTGNYPSYLSNTYYFNWRAGTTLTTQVQPADDLALKLNFIVTNLQGAGNVSIDGYDKDDVAQQENITFTANTTYITESWFQNVTLLTYYGNISTEYTLEITQSRWGVVWRTTPFDGDEEQYYVEEPTLVLGDDSTPTYFKETTCQIYFYTSRTRWNAHIRVEKNVWFQLGEVDDSNAKTGKDGVQLFFDSPNDGLVYGILHSGDLSTAYRFYASSFFGRTVQLGSNENATIWDCMFVGTASKLTNIDGGDLDRVTITEAWLSAVTGTINDVFIYDPQPGYAYHKRGGSGSYEITNIKVRNATYIAYFELMNVPYNFTDADTDTWSILWRVAPTWDSDGEVYRKYSFDLTVSHHGNGSAIQNVNVTLTDTNGLTVFTFLTDANGQISTQKVIYAYYNQTSPDSTATSTFLQSPHNLTLTASGLQTHTLIFNITEPMDLRVCLLPAADRGEYVAVLLAASLIFLPLLTLVIYLLARRKH